MKNLSSYCNASVSMEAAALYKGILYLNYTKWDYENGAIRLYAYNTSSKKFTLSKKNCNINESYGSYALTIDEFTMDVSPHSVSLAKMTASGIKKIKNLSKNCENAVFISGKVYWTHFPTKTEKSIYGGTYTTYDMSKVGIYRCNINGTGKKLLKTIKGSSDSYIFCFLLFMNADNF